MESEELLGNLGQDGNEAAKKVKKSPLISLEKDLGFYAESIKEVAVEIMVEGISSYPIFIAHQHEVNIGEVILNKNDLNTDWTVQASTLEEFIQKGIIHPDKKEQFLKSYKKPESYMCIFVVVPEGANFVYYPYPKQD
jgi:hypothetical protein